MDKKEAQRLEDAIKKITRKVEESLKFFHEVDDLLGRADVPEHIRDVLNIGYHRFSVDWLSNLDEALILVQKEKGDKVKPKSLMQVVRELLKEGRSVEEAATAIGKPISRIEQLMMSPTFFEENDER